MSKRRPDIQINQNNWDEELESEEGGHFQKADENELKSRIIRTAKRRIIRSSDEPDANASSAKPVFSGFSLVSNKSSTTSNDGGVPKPFSFGSGFSSQQSAAAPFASSTIGASSFTVQSKGDAVRSSEFMTKLRELNDAVLNCIKGHIERGDACILSPIFKDYDKYVKELEEKDKTATASSPAKTNVIPTTSAAPFSFSFGPAKSEKTEVSTAAAASPLASAPTQTSTAASLFSFGKPTTSFASSSSGFTFSSETKTNGGTNGNADADEESDEPPKVEFKQVVEEESIYSKRCKVFVKDDGDFKDRGTGTLYLKKVKDDKVQLIVRADTNLGNILLNFLLTSAAPPKLVKNNVMIVCVPDAEANPKKPKSVLVRVKTEKDASELLAELEKYQK